MVKVKEEAGKPAVVEHAVSTDLKEKIKEQITIMKKISTTNKKPKEEDPLGLEESCAAAEVKQEEADPLALETFEEMVERLDPLGISPSSQLKRPS